jgi:hypothetical protein
MIKMLGEIKLIRLKQFQCKKTNKKFILKKENINE